MTMKSSSTKKSILFVTAISRELQVIKSLVKNQSSKNMKTDFLVTGIWNIETTLSLTKKLSEKKYDFVVNIWVCGYKQEKNPLIQIARSVYAPTWKECIVPIFFEYASLKSIYCSEVPIYDDALLWDESYVDMESYGIEKVCESFRIPRLILKVPIDKIWTETHNFDNEAACETLRQNIDINTLFSEIKNYLESLPQKYSPNIYLSHYRFTQSEKIIFEKYFYSYITLSDTSFETFFSTYSALSKKDFLGQLSNTISSLKQLPTW